MARESLQKKLGRVRPPRVRITYDVQTGAAIEKRDLAFIVGVFADLSGTPSQPLPSVAERNFVTVDRGNIDQVIRGASPRLAFTVPNLLGQDGTTLPVELNFGSMDDFAPDRIARQIPEFRTLLDLRTGLSSLRSVLIGNDRLEDMLVEIVRNPELLTQVRAEGFASGSRLLTDRIVVSARLGQNTDETDFIRWLGDFFAEAGSATSAPSSDIEQSISYRIQALDQLITRQLDEIMHAEPMQKLEASWRGLEYLIQQSETSSTLKIKVFNVSKAELIADFNTVATFDQAAVLRRICDESYSADPFGVLVGDYEFDHGPTDIALLEKLSLVAAWLNTPFISAAAPALFRFESFTELAGPRDLSKIFNDPAYLKWNALRKSEDSRYVGLCLPRVLLRLPYGKGDNLEEFDYRELVGEADHAGYLWGNPAYIFAARLTNAFSQYGWCAAIRGVEGGGLVEGLPIDSFSTDDGDVALKCPTEIAITDRRESELASLGFIPLCYFKGTDMALFMAAPSLQKPQVYLDDEANANARLSTQLPYIFACSRFAHFMKAAVLDGLRTFKSGRDRETFLNQWISQYVLLDDVASQESRARFPLREARVAVAETETTPKAYKAVVFLRPHFQLDEMAVSLRFVVPLPSIAST